MLRATTIHSPSNWPRTSPMLGRTPKSCCCTTPSIRASGNGCAVRCSGCSRLTSEPMRIPFLDGFLGSMLIAVAIALLLPQLGASGGVLHLELLKHIGVALVFLLSGAGLSTEKLKAGAANWRLHLFVQLLTFTMFPLLGLLVRVRVGRWLPAEIGST